MEYLREYFTAEFFKKVKPKSRSAGALYFTSSWPHYESMLFLLDQVKNRRPVAIWWYLKVEVQVFLQQIRRNKSNFQGYNLVLAVKLLIAISGVFV